MSSKDAKLPLNQIEDVLGECSIIEIFFVCFALNHSKQTVEPCCFASQNIKCFYEKGKY